MSAIKSALERIAEMFEKDVKRLTPEEKRLAASLPDVGGESLLDMSQDARMARAKEQGFTTDAYRGWTFPEKADGGWFSRNPEIASNNASPFGTGDTFSNGSVASPAAMSAKLRLGRTLNVDWGGKSYKDMPLVDQAVSDPNILKQHGGKRLETDHYPDIAAQHGYDSVTINNIKDSGYGDVAPDTVYHVLSPTDRRATTAAFDPSKANSKDFLAQALLTGGALGGGYAATNSDNKAEAAPWSRAFTKAAVRGLDGALRDVPIYKNPTRADFEAMTRAPLFKGDEFEDHAKVRWMKGPSGDVYAFPGSSMIHDQAASHLRRIGEPMTDYQSDSSARGAGDHGASWQSGMIRRDGEDWTSSDVASLDHLLPPAPAQASGNNGALASALLGTGVAAGASAVGGSQDQADAAPWIPKLSALSEAGKLFRKAPHYDPLLGAPLGSDFANEERSFIAPDRPDLAQWINGGNDGLSPSRRDIQDELIGRQHSIDQLNEMDSVAPMSIDEMLYMGGPDRPYSWTPDVLKKRLESTLGPYGANGSMEKVPLLGLGAATALGATALGANQDEADAFPLRDWGRSLDPVLRATGEEPSLIDHATGVLNKSVPSMFAAAAMQPYVGPELAAPFNAIMGSSAHLDLSQEPQSKNIENKTSVDDSVLWGKKPIFPTASGDRAKHVADDQSFGRWAASHPLDAAEIPARVATAMAQGLGSDALRDPLGTAYDLIDPTFGLGREANKKDPLPSLQITHTGQDPVTLQSDAAKVSAQLQTLLNAVFGQPNDAKGRVGR